MTPKAHWTLSPAHEVVEAILGAAAPNDAVAIVEESFEIDLRFANNTTTTNGVRRRREVSVAVFADDRSGVGVGIASRSGAPDLEALVAEARARAREAGPAEDAAPLIEGVPPALDFTEPPATTDFAQLGPLVSELSTAFQDASAVRHLLAGFASHEVTTTYLGTTRGVRVREAVPTGSFELVARVADGSASTWWGMGTEDLRTVDVEAVADELSRRLAVARHKVDLVPGRYEVLLSPNATADLVVELYGAMSGREAEDGSSVFSGPSGGTRIGERLAAAPFSLWSDPGATGIGCERHVIAGVSSADQSVFDNGAPIGPVSWIDGGRLARLRYHRAGAARSGQPFSPPVGNLGLSLPGATRSLEEMIQATERALLVTCLWYIREVDPATLLLTGLTRDGVYLVQDGEVVGEVNNFRFNESPLDLFERVLESGATVRTISREWGEWMNRTAMPPLRVAEFNMSSVSQAR